MNGMSSGTTTLLPDSVSAWSASAAIGVSTAESTEAVKAIKCSIGYDSLAVWRLIARQNGPSLASKKRLARGLRIDWDRGIAPVRDGMFLRIDGIEVDTALGTLAVAVRIEVGLTARRLCARLLRLRGRRITASRYWIVGHAYRSPSFVMVC